VAVIDAWDAMTSDRPYRKALGREKAEAELRRGAGTQFDPKVVEAFLKLEDEEAAKEQPASARS
jgi:HD-GYP domain-containing protein (c-di-GMP phosphodiesterase class II)